jgi:hypothetical protein
MTKLFPLLFLFLILPLAYAHSPLLPAGNNPNYQAVMFTTDEPPFEHKLEKLSVQLFYAPTNMPITELDTVHERKMHIFIVGQDLQTFAHLHPEDFHGGFAGQSQGVYSIDYSFPQAGNYLVVFDYTHDGQGLLNEIPVQVLGLSYMDKPRYDYSTTKEYVPYEVSLEKPAQIEAGKEVALSYHLKENGQDIHDLQMYLGSEVHLFVVKDDFTFAGHTHSYIPGHDFHTGNMTQHYVGPTVPVKLTFPSPGTYALFGQFEHNNSIITTQFLVEVGTPVEKVTSTAGKWYEAALIALACIVGIGMILHSRWRKKNQ